MSISSSDFLRDNLSCCLSFSAFLITEVFPPIQYLFPFFIYGNSSRSSFYDSVFSFRLFVFSVRRVSVSPIVYLFSLFNLSLRIVVAKYSDHYVFLAIFCKRALPSWLPFSHLYGENQFSISTLSNWKKPCNIIGSIFFAYHVTWFSHAMFHVMTKPCHINFPSYAHVMFRKMPLFVPNLFYWKSAQNFVVLWSCRLSVKKKGTGAITKKGEMRLWTEQLYQLSLRT